MCDQCKGPVKQSSMVRIVITEGMGRDDAGNECESGPDERIFCSYKCVREWFASW